MIQTFSNREPNLYFPMQNSPYKNTPFNFQHTYRGAKRVTYFLFFAITMITALFVHYFQYITFSETNRDVDVKESKHLIIIDLKYFKHYINETWLSIYFENTIWFIGTTWNVLKKKKLILSDGRLNGFQLI